MDNRSAGTIVTRSLILSFFVLLAAAWPAAAAEPPVLLSSFGPDGTTASDFQHAGPLAFDQQAQTIYVLDHGAGTLSKFDADGQPVDFGGAAGYISGNAITGLSLFPNPDESQVAVDSVSHRIYVTSANSVRAFEANGEAAEFSAGPGAGTSAIPGFAELLGIAVDANGDIYASDYSGFVRIYAPSGELITQFETATPANLAVASDGSVYVNRYIGTVLEFTPSEFPVTATTTYTAAAEPVNSRASLSLAVDPATDNLYIAEEKEIGEYDASGALLATFPAAGEEGQLSFSEGVAVDGASGEVYVSDATQPPPGPSQVKIFGTPVIPVLPPSIDSISVADVTADSANLRAQINPHTLATSYHFEYGLQDCSALPNPCTSVPLPDASVGSGSKAVAVSRHISGLQPGSTYHYRVVAQNSLDVSASPDRTFVTQQPGAPFALADNRAWELVSPAEKPGGGAIVPPSVGPSQASQSGDAFTYLTSSPIESAPAGNRSLDRATSLARHGSSGWRSAEITPPHETSSPASLGTEYRLFSPDLANALVEPFGAGPLSVEASERTPYMRENFSEPPRWRPLVTGKEGYANVPPETHFGGAPDEQLHFFRGPIRISGASPNLHHVVVASQLPLSSDAAGALDGTPGGTLLYEWSDGPLRLVSALPDGEGGGAVAGRLGAGASSVLHAVSADGRYVYWSNDARTALYVRDVQGSETVRLDVPAGGSGSGAANPRFQGASADGTRAFFTDTQQLTPGAGEAGADLYVCELVQHEGAMECDLRDLTPASGEAADVQGLVSGLSENGGTVYFVANGVLAAGASPGSCEPSESAPASAACSLYVARLDGSGWSTAFIATLSNHDAVDWGFPPYLDNPTSSLLAAAASPSGRYFTFMSDRSLTGYDNVDAVSGVAAQEVFLYDSATASVRCVSCGPTGGRPHGSFFAGGVAPLSDWGVVWPKTWIAANLPDPQAPENASTSLYRPRVVLDNGRLFFNAFDSLAPADSNGNWDAYEYEPTGLGGCSAGGGSSGVVVVEGGCVSLISSGDSSRESGVLDASASGDDVFVLTAASLSAADADSAYDVYDAHVCGSGWSCSTPAAPPAPCEGEACLAPPAAPSDPTPASAAFSGKGNLKVRKHHRKRKHHKHHKRGHRRHGGRR